MPPAHLYDRIDAVVRAIGWTRIEVPEITLDFSGCTFLSDSGAAVLASFKIRRDRRSLRTAIDWSTVPPAVARQLRRWKLASLFDRRGRMNTG